MATPPVGADVVARLADFDENAGVGDDDGQTGQQEAEGEEEFLGRAAVVAAQDGARERRFFEAEPAPDAGQRRRHQTEGEEPRAGDHGRDQRPLVDLVVERRRRDQNVPAPCRRHREA